MVANYLTIAIMFMATIGLLFGHAAGNITDDIKRCKSGFETVMLKCQKPTGSTTPSNTMLTPCCKAVQENMNVLSSRDCMCTFPAALKKGNHPKTLGKFFDFLKTNQQIKSCPIQMPEKCSLISKIIDRDLTDLVVIGKDICNERLEDMTKFCAPSVGQMQTIKPNDFASSLCCLEFSLIQKCSCILEDLKGKLLQFVEKNVQMFPCGTPGHPFSPSMEIEKCPKFPKGSTRSRASDFCKDHPEKCAPKGRTIPLIPDDLDDPIDHIPEADLSMDPIPTLLEELLSIQI